MKMSDKVLGLVQATAWYALIFTILYSIKYDVNLYISSLIILVLFLLGMTSCPLVRHTQAWKDAWREQ